MITTGVSGAAWRASITPWGAVEPWDGSTTLDWHIAADDRWHTPREEAAVRQTRLGGTAVVETRVQIPDGVAVQRIYSVADHRGLTVVEVQNASPLPIAVAFTRGDLLTALAATAPIAGITLPTASIAVPIGHRATVKVALAHDGRGAGRLPDALPSAAAVMRGWTAATEVASRMLLPDAALVERAIGARCELLLCGPADPDDDPVAFVLAVAELVRMGYPATRWLPDLAHAVEIAAKSGEPAWSMAAALEAAAVVFERGGESRAQRDLAALRTRMRLDAGPPAGPLAAAAPPAVPDELPDEPARVVAWVERHLVAPVSGGAELLPGGLPPAWAGRDFEVWGLVSGGASSLSYAVRWHGPRPAVLWEQHGSPLTLTAPRVAPDWSTAATEGEALWPVPPGLEPVGG